MIISMAEVESEIDRRADLILDSAELFLDHSIQERQNYIKDPLRWTRAGRVATLPQSKGQRKKACKAARLEKSKKYKSKKKSTLKNLEEIQKSTIINLTL